MEEHNIISGSDSAVAEVLAEMAGNKVLFKRIALPDRYPPEVGRQVYPAPSQNTPPPAGGCGPARTFCLG